MEEPEDKKESKPEGSGWEYRTRLPIQDRMVEVVGLAKKAAEAELAAARRKLRKMRYGS